MLPSLLRLPILLFLSLSLSLVSSLGGQNCSPPSLWAPVVFALGDFLSVAAVLYLFLPTPATGVVSSCWASLVCLFSWSWYTWGFSTRCHVAGCPSGVPLLAGPLRVAGRTGSAPLPPLDLVVVSASEVLRGGGGGAPSSGPSGFRSWEPSPFRRLSVPPLAGLEGQRCGAVGCRGAEGWLLSALPQHPSSSNVPIPMPSSSPTSIKGAAMEEVILGFIAKGAVELAPLPSPGFYSRLFVVWRTSGSWLPVIALSHLNRFVDVSPLQMGTIQSVLLSVRQGDWVASIDLKEAYLQVPVHPASRHFLRFMFWDTVYQFKALCFDLSTAPQVFTRVMAPVSAILHSMGIRMRRYLDDWLVQSSSRESFLGDLQTVLHLCHELGIVVNPQKSNLVPSQVVQYLGVVIDSTSFRASPSEERISRLQSTAAEFQSCASPTASLWLSLLGVLSSLAHLVPGGRLRMRSLQLCLHRSWDRQDLEAPVYASMECLRDLQWWLHLPRLSLGVSLCQVSPDLHFWSDASDVGWGAHLDRQIASGLWNAQQAALSLTPGNC